MKLKLFMREKIYVLNFCRSYKFLILISDWYVFLYLEMFLFFFGRVSKLWECFVMVIIIYVFNLKLMVMVFISVFYNGMIWIFCVILSLWCVLV